MDTEAAAIDRTERHLRILQELADIGMRLARAVEAEVLAPPAAAEAAEPAVPARFAGADLGLVFSRIAKAVRQTLALETRLADGLETARRDQARRRANAEQLTLQHRQEDIRDFVAQAVEAEGERRELPETEVERLLDDLDERLEEGRYDDALADAPIPELITRICNDLGVSPDWRLWKHLDWGAEFLREHTPADIGAERWLGEYPPPDDPDSS